MTENTIEKQNETIIDLLKLSNHLTKILITTIIAFANKNIKLLDTIQEQLIINETHTIQ